MVDGRICTLGQQHLFVCGSCRIFQISRPWHEHTLRYNIGGSMPRRPETAYSHPQPQGTSTLGGVRTLVQARRQWGGAPDGDAGAPHRAGTVSSDPNKSCPDSRHIPGYKTHRRAMRQLPHSCLRTTTTLAGRWTATTRTRVRTRPPDPQARVGTSSTARGDAPAQWSCPEGVLMVPFRRCADPV